MKGLSPEQFGKLLDPPLSRFRIYGLCEEGRVTGAKKVDGRWNIPADAKIVGKGWRSKSSGLKNLSVKEYSERNNISTQRVYQLVNAGKIPGAKKTDKGWDLPKEARLPGRRW